MTPSFNTTLTPPVAGKGAAGMNGVDQLVLDFLREHNLPGATVAVSKQGRLVWSKGYGYANTDQKLEMQPWHRSRIGSVSKVLQHPVEQDRCGMRQG